MSSNHSSNCLFSERYLLVRLARHIYLIHTDNNEILQTINKMPSAVFVDEIFEFVEAGFTPEDIYIVAVRHTYLGIWDTVTGQPMRVLQTNISPITAMFTCRYANRVVTTLEDQTMQVSKRKYSPNICCANNLYVQFVAML